MGQQLVTLLSAIAFVCVVGGWSLFTVRHELAALRAGRRAARRRALARRSLTAPPAVRRDNRPVAVRG